MNTATVISSAQTISKPLSHLFLGGRHELETLIHLQFGSSVDCQVSVQRMYSAPEDGLAFFCWSWNSLHFASMADPLSASGTRVEDIERRARSGGGMFY